MASKERGDLMDGNERGELLANNLIKDLEKMKAERDKQLANEKSRAIDHEKALAQIIVQQAIKNAQFICKSDMISNSLVKEQAARAQLDAELEKMKAERDKQLANEKSRAIDHEKALAQIIVQQAIKNAQFICKSDMISNSLVKEQAARAQLDAELEKMKAERDKQLANEKSRAIDHEKALAQIIVQQAIKNAQFICKSDMISNSLVKEQAARAQLDAELEKMKAERDKQLANEKSRAIDHEKALAQIIVQQAIKNAQFICKSDMISNSLVKEQAARAQLDAELEKMKAERDKQLANEKGRAIDHEKALAQIIVQQAIKNAQFICKSDMISNSLVKERAARAQLDAELEEMKAEREKQLANEKSRAIDHEKALAQIIVQQAIKNAQFICKSDMIYNSLVKEQAARAQLDAELEEMKAEREKQLANEKSRAIDHEKALAQFIVQQTIKNAQFICKLDMISNSLVKERAARAQLDAELEEMKAEREKQLANEKSRAIDHEKALAQIIVQQAIKNAQFICKSDMISNSLVKERAARAQLDAELEEMKAERDKQLANEKSRAIDHEKALAQIIVQQAINAQFICKSDMISNSLVKERAARAQLDAELEEMKAEREKQLANEKSRTIDHEKALAQVIVPQTIKNAQFICKSDMICNSLVKERAARAQLDAEKYIIKNCVETDVDTGIQDLQNDPAEPEQKKYIIKNCVETDVDTGLQDLQNDPAEPEQKVSWLKTIGCVAGTVLGTGIIGFGLYKYMNN